MTSQVQEKYWNIEGVTANSNLLVQTKCVGSERLALVSRKMGVFVLGNLNKLLGGGVLEAESSEI